MQVAELDEVQYELEQDGELVRRQIGRKVWEERGFATVAIAYQERSSGGDWKPARVALLRFRRQHEVWKCQAKMALPGSQAVALATLIQGWEPELAGGDDALDRDDD